LTVALFEERLAGLCFVVGFGLAVLVPVAATETAELVEEADAGVTGVAGAGAGAADLRGTGRWAGRGGTTMLSAGGALEMPPIEEGRNEPESRNSAMAPAPRNSGIPTSAAPRAIRASGPIIILPAHCSAGPRLPLPSFTFLEPSARDTRKPCAVQHPFRTECRSFRGL
jgi:hypothetical protein